MKNLKVLKVVIPFLIIITILSCNKDDKDLNLTNDLIGEWRRSDFSDNSEYILGFLPENRGYESWSTRHPDGTAISYAIPIKWSTNNNLLTLDFFDGDIIITDFSFNSDGQLFLKDFTDLYFNKLE